MNKTIDQTINDIVMAQKIYDKTGNRRIMDKRSVEYRRFVSGCKAGIELEKKRVQRLVKVVEKLKIGVNASESFRAHLYLELYKAFNEYNEGK